MSSSRNSADEPGSLEAIPLISSTSNTIEPNYVPLSETGSSSDNTPTNETGVCRICLETEILDNLDQPCACKGTLQRAHRECLQRWINERDQTGDQALICEICKGKYKDGYNAPPDRRPRRNERLLVLVVDPETGLASTRPIIASETDEDDYPERMHPARACFATLFLFMMCSFLLLHLFAVLPNREIPGSELPAPTTQDDADAQFEDVSATLLLLWLFMRVLVLVAPVYTLSQIMARRRWGRAERWRSQEIELDAVVVRSDTDVGSTGSPRDTPGALVSAPRR